MESTNLLPYALAALGGLIMVGLGVLITQNRRQSDEQKETNNALTSQGTTLTEIRTTLVGADGRSGIVRSVTELQQWREAERDRQLEDARAELAEFQRTKHGRTA